MNWFIFIAGILYLAGATLDLLKGNYSLGAIFVAYAFANFLLARMGH